MNLASERPFWDLAEAEIPDFARSAPGFPIPPQYLGGVVDNLLVLVGHARIVAAALTKDGVAADDLAAPTEAFEP